MPFKTKEEENAYRRKRYAENREKIREQKREAYQRNKNNNRENRLARQRDGWAKNEEVRNANRDRKRKGYDRDPDAAKRKAREFYANNREDQARKAKDRKRRNDPTRGLDSIARSFAKGDISVDEFNRRYNEAIKRVHERFIQESESRGRRDKTP